VSELEQVGYVERVPDPQDGRARRVVFSRRGLELIRDIDEITREIMDGFAAALGAERLDQLCSLLAELDVVVNGEDAPVRVVAAVEGDGAPSGEA
jgi:DNA-binding MarR family transcriptional regulator